MAKAVGEELQATSNPAVWQTANVPASVNGVAIYVADARLNAGFTVSATGAITFDVAPIDQPYADYEYLATTASSGSTSYASVDDVRAEGLTDATLYPDSRIQGALDLWASVIERLTGRFFGAKQLTLVMDGSDRPELFLPIPIIMVSKLFKNGAFNDPSDIVDPSRYRVYNRVQPSPGMGEDDRDNPKIVLSSFNGNSDFYARVVDDLSGYRGFVRGHQNQMVVGTFGYTGDGVASIPLLIKRALLKLVLRNIDQLAPGSTPIDPLSGQKGQVIMETTDAHSVQFQAPKKQNPLIELTGDPEVNQILRLFKRPPTMKVTGSYYFGGSLS